MKLGLITDIHEQVQPLCQALARLEQERVDQIVMIGDVLEAGEDIDETCRLLADAGAVGVWGNHDFGLCVDPSEDIRSKFSSAVLEYMASLKPRLQIGGCHFTHVEPWLNPEDVMDIWYFDGPPDEHRKLERIFDATSDWIMFAGHFHKWLLATPEGISPWAGRGPIRLQQSNRYFIAVGALCDGDFAVFDTETAVLAPFRV